MVVKLKICIFAFLLIIDLVNATEFYELNAILVDNKTLYGPNCRIQGGPTSYQVDVLVVNPSPNATLKVTYMYYNLSSGGYEDGGKICDVMRGASQSCTLTIYTPTGGKNGSDQIPFKLSGTFGVESYCGGPFCEGRVVYEKELNVTVNHYTSLYEESVITKIDIAMKEYGPVFQEYTNCPNANASALAELQDASSELLSASNDLTICNIQQAYNLTTDAIVKIREVNSSYTQELCIPPPPQNDTNNTQLPSDHNTTQNNETNETPVIQPPVNSQPSPPSSTDNISQVVLSLAKGCMPFSILMAMFVIAVWSERKSKTNV
ncbi:MAG: hypothetical protein NT130_03260 [Candidatus Micrarchaeota archaeon]|nr:hypothetical protein [Candidatus Micrarchaeota archaeon]